MTNITPQNNFGHLYKEAGLDVFIIDKSSHKEIYLTITPQANETVSDLLHKFTGVLQQNQASVLKQTVLGTVKSFPSAFEELSEIYGPVDWPITWVEGQNYHGQPVSGIMAVAVSGIPVERILLNDRVVGSVIENADAKTCYLGNITSGDASLPEDLQTGQIFEQIMTALQSVGMNFSNVFRTWFYLNNILGLVW